MLSLAFTASNKKMLKMMVAEPKTTVAAIVHERGYINTLERAEERVKT